jgi:hypothetical protein
MDSNFRFLVARPSNRHGRSDCFLETWSGSVGKPEVRIHLPPAGSLVRTCRQSKRRWFRADHFLLAHLRARACALRALVDGEDLADDQPVEQHADRSETQFGGRLGGAIHDLGSMDVPRGLGRD